MSEAETRAELIAPKLKAYGWGVVENSKILPAAPVFQIPGKRVSQNQTNPIFSNKIKFVTINLHLGVYC